MKKRILMFLLTSVMAVGGLCGCGDKAASTSNSADSNTASSGETSASSAEKKDVKIIVGSKDFAESMIVGQMYIKLLEANGYTVTDKTNVAGSDVCQKAIETGDFTVYPEYTGTLWFMVCGHDTVPEGGPTALYDDLEAELGEGGIYRMGKRCEVNNTYAFVMMPDRMEELGINCLSDIGAYIAEHPGELKFAGAHEFNIRSDGLIGMKDFYGIDFGDNVHSMEKGLAIQAVAEGQIDVSMVDATDGRIQKYGLSLVEDDKSYFPTYNMVPLYNQKFADENPEVVELLDQLAPYITDVQMQELNAKVDVDNDEPDEVAEEFLKEVGLIS